jgi:hypothetical protein
MTVTFSIAVQIQSKVLRAWPRTNSDPPDIVPVVPSAGGIVGEAEVPHNDER